MNAETLGFSLRACGGRTLLNAELVHGDRARIIVPTVYRDDYLLALRALTRQGNADPYIRMLDRAQDFTSRIDFNDYEDALSLHRSGSGCSRPPAVRRSIGAPGACTWGESR